MVIIASDGIWDCIGNDALAHYFVDKLETGARMDAIIEELMVLLCPERQHNM
eukprot:CAMPEP_0116935874 /NCGR_PEP_ID=MMETSP0467-20121206/30548_1 /TAXON_ID=283647 /ORGANISM="Mesodinium pulex, Strain SPMC105" /LENGTH=51 /DNA_ID=CAMNT_0004617341 /DNA_START=988 /DNA_END=1143 /DNA_ORIENTATION=-